MGDTGEATGSTETQVITVRFWAGAKAAAGTPSQDVATDVPLSLAEVRRRVLDAHPGNTRLAAVMDVCSVLVGDRPVGSEDPATVLVAPGEFVEFLPPFAGG